MDPLVRAIRNRDGDALNRFLEKHRGRLRDWVRFRLGVPAGRGADQSDAVQDVSVRIWESICTFQGTTEAELLGWFQQKLRWWVVDLSRKQVLTSVRRETPGFAPESGSVLANVAADTRSPSRFAMQLEAEARIRRAAGALTNDECVILMLRDVDGVPLKEIAREYGTSAAEIARQYLSAAEAVQAAEPVPEDSVGEQRAERLAQALARLPRLQRQAVLLKHIEDYSMEETAAALGTTPAAVGAAVYRGMKELKSRLGGTAARGEADGDRC